MDKQALREAVRGDLESRGIARNRAATPDAPQLPVRRATLRADKILRVAPCG